MTTPTSDSNDQQRANYARFLFTDVVPGLARASDQGPRLQSFGLIPSVDEWGKDESQAQKDAQSLLDATSELRPPPDTPGADAIDASIMFMVALKALDLDDPLISGIALRERHVQAAGWVCRNFRKWIPWDCDSA